ncbi:hypothetical protein Hanom_Chr01g00085821 [Helianthus anomalus]
MSWDYYWPITVRVEEIEPNTKDNRVTVKGKAADAVKVAERVRRKTGKHVEIISPVQKKQQPEKKPEKKPEVISLVSAKYIVSIWGVHGWFGSVQFGFEPH